MSLREKMMLMIGVVFVAALVIAFVVSQTIVMKRFAELERDNTNQNTGRAVSAVSQDISSVATIVSDWAPWDDTYAFVQDGNGEYIASNLSDATISNLSLNVMLFINNDGELVYGKAFDLENQTERPLSASLEGLASADTPFMQLLSDQSSVSGILSLPEGPLLVAAQPILTSQKQGPVQGSLVMGRYLDAAEVQSLAEQTALSLSLHQLDDEEVPKELSDEAPVITRPLSDETVAGYGLLNDVYGNPATIMRADMPRDIYKQGQQTGYWLIVYLAAAFVMFALAAIILVNRVILSRLLGLSKNVDRVRDTGDLTERVTVKGKDEISRLGGAINGMLSSLDKSQQELTEREAEKHALLNAIPDLMFRLDEGGTILDARAAEGSGPATTQGRSTDGKAYQELPQYRALSAEVVHWGLPFVKQALQTGETQMFEIQIPLNDETAFYEVRVAASSRNEALVMVRDITERKRVEGHLRESFLKLERAMEGTIQAITLTVESRDHYTAGHQRRVAQLGCAIAREMGFTPDQIQAIRVAGLLHDIGKLSVPQEILSKPGKLSDVELQLIKVHSQVGYDILKNVEFPWPIADIVIQHHERMNGSGYPSGIREDNILIEARILGVADVVEAMSSHRPYRPPLGIDKALEEISRNSGVLYDPNVVQACLRVFGERGFKFE